MTRFIASRKLGRATSVLASTGTSDGAKKRFQFKEEPFRSRWSHVNMVSMRMMLAVGLTCVGIPSWAGKEADVRSGVRQAVKTGRARLGETIMQSSSVTDAFNILNRVQFSAPGPTLAPAPRQVTPGRLNSRSGSSFDSIVESRRRQRKRPSAMLLMQFAAVVAVTQDRSAIRKTSLDVQGRRTVESIPEEYVTNGRQYIAVASGGNILSFALGTP